MAKKFKNIIFSFTRRSNLQKNTTRWPCPHCGNAASVSICRLRWGFNYCEKCKSHYETSECMEDEDFD